MLAWTVQFSKLYAANRIPALRYLASRVEISYYVSALTVLIYDDHLHSGPEDTSGQLVQKVLVFVLLFLLFDLLVGAVMAQANLKLCS